MSNKVIKTISAQCPTTLEELKTVDGLGEAKFREYGERLVKNIANFVETEDLSECLAKQKSIMQSSPLSALPLSATNDAEYLNKKRKASVAVAPSALSGASMVGGTKKAAKWVAPSATATTAAAAASSNNYANDDDDDEFPMDFEIPDDIVLPGDKPSF